MTFRLSLSAAGAFAAVLACMAPTAARADAIYLIWPGVVGTETIPTAPSVSGAIALNTYGQSFSNPYAGFQTVTPKFQCNGITLSKQADGTTASFVSAMLKITTIPKLTVRFTTPGVIAGTTFVPVEIVVLNAQIVRVSQSIDASAGGTATLNDSVKLLATTFEVTSAAQTPTGATTSISKFGWNCVSGVAVPF